MGQLAYSETLETHACGECGVRFAMPGALTRNLLETKRTFYCPNGHPRVFTESTSDKLRAELARERQRREMAEREVAAEKSRADRVQRKADRDAKRTNNGVCTCCNRTFANLRQHMARTHPETAK